MARNDIQKLLEENNKKLVQAERENAIYDAVEAMGITTPSRVYGGWNLYGTVALITYTIGGYGNTIQSWEEIPAIIEKFPVVPAMTLKKKGFANSVVPARYVENIPDNVFERDYDGAEDMLPAWVHVQPRFDTEFRFFSELPEIGIVEIVATGSSYFPFGTCHSKKVVGADGIYYENRSFTWNDRCMTIKDDPDTTIGMIQSWSTWSPPESPGSFYAVWRLVGGDEGIHPASILRQCLGSPIA